MEISQYFEAISREIQHQSERARDSFLSHRPTVGESKEAIISSFFERHLPKNFGVGRGIVIARDGQVSNQADLVIYDQLLNCPLNTDFPASLFPVESVYALVEAKSKLTPSELNDAILKGRRFKRMNRQFLPGPTEPRISESLFVIFAFEAAKPETFKQTLVEAISTVPIEEQPDFVLVSNSMVATLGQYFQISKLGQSDSPHRRGLEILGPDHVNKITGEGLDVYELGGHSLMAFFIWFTSWLQYAGPRTTALQTYLQPAVWGRKI